MSITALEIQQEGFEHSLRGYDVTQVDEFLERVAHEVDAMNTQIADLQQRLALANASSSGGSGPVVDRAAVDAANQRAAAAEVKASDLEKQLASAKKQLSEKSEIDSAISNAFISAQRSADALKEDARVEGERIYREAEAKAREFIREALGEKQRILNEIDVLENSAKRFREEYKKLLARFSNEAETDFGNLRPPQIPDEIVNEVLPKFEGAENLGASASVPAGGSEPDVPAVFAAEAQAPSSFASQKQTGGVGIMSPSISELLDDTVLIDEIDE